LTRLYAGRGPEATQWRSGVEDQTTTSRSQSTSSPELHFVQQLDVLQQQSLNKYLQWQKVTSVAVHKQGKKEPKENSHRSNSQADSTTPRMKDSNSSL
jgi:hypothetical protein